ncbi:MAG: 3-isopropylmalate dehydratase [Ectothiorhodospiraceae bacterium]|nr:3-isopropylmalate dehydratase [Ectothiorhodospiraceae bacterium]
MRGATFRLDGRVLLLACDATVVDRQLAGEDVDPDTAGPLRDDVSTDEITPIPVLTHYDETLGRFPYLGLTVDGRRPIGVDAVRAGGFVVTVAGRRYGKGSSREHSPVAERAAGIRLVIAESFERIYRQNADNVGLLTSTDLGLVARLRRGESIAIDELVADRDPLAAAIVRSGGLLGYGARRLRGARPAEPRPTEPARPRTLTEKILARRVLATTDTDATLVSGNGVFVRADWRFIHEYYTAMCAHLLHASRGKPITLHEPSTVIAFEDHLSYAHRSPVHATPEMGAGVRRLSDGHRAFVAETGIVDHGYLPGGEGSEGISHALMAETYALPGQLVVGTDSHTPHSGALGCLAFGVGTTEMANAMVTGAVRVTVPETLRVMLRGPMPEGITAKDVVLHLLALPSIRDGLGIGKVFEFAGDALAGLDTDERATLTNMTAELGGLTGIVEPDAETVRFVRERRGVDIALEPWMRADADAPYAAVIEVDCTALSPMVAAPGDPGNGVAIGQLARPVRIDIAYGGSCTAGKRTDFDHYHAVLAWAAERGLRVADHVALYLQFGTRAVRDYCVRRGYLETFERVGATLLEPACGACANCGPGSSTAAEQVTVSAINRNFPGRSGPGQVWLASPPTVAASAIAGELVSFAELTASYREPTGEHR